MEVIDLALGLSPIEALAALSRLRQASMRLQRPETQQVLHIADRDARHQSNAMRPVV